MRPHLVDGTYELFRHYFGVPEEERSGRGAVRGVLGSVLSIVERDSPFVGVATDHVIESFRNDLYPGYKTSAGVPEDLLAVFPLLEDSLRDMGVLVWAMVDVEADDALASAAAVLADDERVDQVVICTPDKDLGQCVTGRRVVQLDRRRQVELDEAAVTAKFGVGPAAIPDYLALVGDTADGFPGLKGWGAKSAAAVLRRYGHIENIPETALRWDVDGVRSATALAATLAEQRELALLFKVLATLRVDRGLVGDVEELRWRGPHNGFARRCAELGADGLPERASALERRRQG